MSKHLNLGRVIDMTITQVFSDPHAYRIVHAIVDDDGLHYESEAALHHADNEVEMLKLPTREEDKLAIQRAVCATTAIQG